MIQQAKWLNCGVQDLAAVVDQLQGMPVTSKPSQFTQPKGMAHAYRTDQPTCRLEVSCSERFCPGIGANRRQHTRMLASALMLAPAHRHALRSLSSDASRHRPGCGCCTVRFNGFVQPPCRWNARTGQLGTTPAGQHAQRGKGTRRWTSARKGRPAHSLALPKQTAALFLASSRDCVLLMLRRRTTSV